MAELILNPSSYNSTNSSYTTAQNITNAYADSTSTTYARFTMKTGSNASSYISYTFDFSSIPASATIESITCVAKARVSSTSYVSTAVAQFYKNTTAVGTSVSYRSTSTSNTCSLTNTGTWTITDLANLQLRFTASRGTSNTSRAAYIYVYGADLTVTYTLPNKTVTTTISNGILISPTVANATVNEGEDYIINFNGNNDTFFKSMTVNGVTVTPSTANLELPPPSYTITTNYGTYSGALTDMVDGDNNSYWWSSAAQSSGKYILFTFSDNINLTYFSTYSASSTDYPSSVNELQVSTDGSTYTTIGTFSDSNTSTFSNLTATGIKYVRIMSTGSNSKWLQIGEITLTYSAASLGSEYYTYTISNVSENTLVNIIFGENAAYYFKIDGVWKKVLEVYKKENNTWTSFNYEYDNTKKLVYKGHNSSDIIGEVTENYDVVITDTSIPNGTYYFYYEDENKQKLEDWGVIGSDNFTGYNGGASTTGREVGTISNSDYTITLTDSTLPDDTYTMYYENSAGEKLEGWDSIGTITK